MNYTLCDPSRYCTNCSTELYVEEVAACGFQGMCMECDPLITPSVVNTIQQPTGGNKMFKVYSPTTPNEDVFFKLQPNGTSINLVAVKADGAQYPSGNVLTILKDGRIQLSGGVNKNIGLQVDPTTGKVRTI